MTGWILRQTMHPRSRKPPPEPGWAALVLRWLAMRFPPGARRAVGTSRNNS
jgi:hypothetical protein